VKLVVSLHDVSPYTWEASARILEAFPGVPMSLLVVPDHHGRGHFLRFPEFCHWLREMVAAGHEAVIHGYFHRRTRGERETAGTRLLTRMYTADEGEFFDINQPEALALVSLAHAEFQAAGLDPVGFIAPAWLLSAGGESALRALGIRYTTRLGSILNFEKGITEHSQSLVWSVRSGWRRGCSLAWNAALFAKLSNAPLMRIGIHPQDLRHRRVWAQIQRCVDRALERREPTTYANWTACTVGL